MGRRLEWGLLAVAAVCCFATHAAAQGKLHGSAGLRVLQQLPIFWADQLASPCMGRAVCAVCVSMGGRGGSTLHISNHVCSQMWLSWLPPRACCAMLPVNRG
jgi:hypothetical protein